MTYTIIIILIAFLIVCGIAATAIQQHNQRKADEKREEVNRQRSFYEETEGLIVAALQMPVSQLLIFTLRNRSINCLTAIHEFSPNIDIYNKIEDIKKLLALIDIKKPAPDPNTFKLPKTDKIIIQYIKTVKKLRSTLRIEHSKKNIETNLFVQEETALASLQLRVNIETLMKRATDAVENNMQGSARQYIEKGITALSNHKTQSDYIIERKTDFETMRDGLEMNVKDNNLKQIMAEKEKENKEIESLFAPKKKW